MDEQQVVLRILDILQRDVSLTNYFSSNIEWLSDRLSYWQKNYIRVGLIGVTSSGKSTLLNALFGEEMLPVKVRPSSGVLVTCAKDVHKQADVYFDSGKVKRLSGNISTELAQYGDEYYNPGNQKGVKYLDVRSPNFALDETVQIVDSPGLDADGLEGHEALTMETLLPSVDLSIYMVTLKANSDESTYRILHTMRRHNKPLIVVQNMADSVLPKIGKGGVILKTRDIVLSEHRERMQKIIGKVDENLLSRIAIVQVSAKSGLSSHKTGDRDFYKESGIPQLIQCINQQVKAIRPKIVANRLMQVRNHLWEVIEIEEAKLSQAIKNPQTIQAPNDVFLEQRDQANRRFAQTKKNMESIVSGIEKDLAETASELDSRAESQLVFAKSRAEIAEKALVSQINGFDGEVRKLLSRLNLNPSDYVGDVLPNRSVQNAKFAVKKRVKVEYDEEKEDGFLAWGKRKLGLGGYKRVRRETEVLDVQAMKDNLGDYAKVLKSYIENNLAQWAGRMTKLQQVINQEITRREEEQQQKEHIWLEMEKRRKLIMELKSILAEITPEMGDMLSEIAATVNVNISQGGEQIRIPSTAYNCYRLSHTIAQLSFWLASDYCQQDNSSYMCEPIKTTLIWGSDTYCLHQFVQQFFNISLTEKDEQTLEQHGYIFKEAANDTDFTFVIVNESKVSYNINAVRKIVATLGNHYNIYLLVNAIQPGAMKKQLRSSPLWGIMDAKKAVINWVAQSFTEFTNGGNVGEGVESLLLLRKTFDPAGKGLFLINHSEAAYTLALMHLQSLPSVTLADEQSCMELVKKIVRGDSIVMSHIAEIVRTFAVWRQHEGGNRE